MFGLQGTLTGIHVVGPGTLSNWPTGIGALITSNSSVSLLKVKANCSIAFSDGFYLDSTTSQWTLLGNAVEGPGNNQSFGMLVFGSGHTIVGNRVDNTIVLSEGSSNNYIAGNTLSDSLVLFGSSNNVVFGNFASNNSVGSGIYDYGGSNNQILANTTVNNKGGPGIWLTAGQPESLSP